MKLLHVMHDFLPVHRAGAELYAYHLGRALVARGHEVAVLCAEFDPTRRHLSVARREYGGLPVTEVVNNWDFATFEETWRSPALGALLRELIVEAAPDVVHVHNLLTLTLELPALADELGIPVVATLHDHGLCCPSGGTRLHVAEAHVCETLDLARCARCAPESPLHRQRALRGLVRQVGRALPLVSAARQLAPGALALGERTWARVAGREGVTEEDLRRRLDGARLAASRVRCFVAPSRALALAHVEAGVVPAARVTVAPHGLPRFDVTRVPEAAGRLRVGFVGTLAWHKGAHVLVDALRQLPAERLVVRLHGSAATAADYVADLRRRAAGLPVELPGGFSEEERGRIYGALDVLVVPSLWPEAWGLVVQEARLAGVAVVASRAGGLAELVRDDVDGLLVPPGSAPALAAALRRLLEEPGLRERLVAAAPAVRTIDDDASGWEQRYAQVAAAARAPRARRLVAVIVCFRSPERTMRAVRALGDQTRPPDHVVVVDNGGQDERALRAGLPGATVLATPRNLGFAGGVNAGLRAALATDADAVLLLNDDATLAADAVARLEAALELPRVAIVGPALVDAGDRDTIESLGMTFDLRSRRLQETARGTSYARVADVAGPRDVQAVSGCVALVSTRALAQLGLFDEGFFFYYEDLELCLRAGRAGWRVVLEPGAVAWHEGSGSIGRRSPRRLYHAVRGHLRLGQKLGGPHARARQVAVVGWNVLHAVVRGRDFEAGALGQVLRGVADHARGRPHEA